MSEQWKPMAVDFTITGDEAKALAKTDDPETLLKEILRKKLNLPPGAEIDVSGLKIAPAERSLNG